MLGWVLGQPFDGLDRSLVAGLNSSRLISINEIYDIGLSRRSIK
jgi:hypothetical protein